MSTKARNILIISGGVLIVLLIVFNVIAQRNRGTKVETQKIEKRELKAIVSASGKIRAKVSVDISASTSGKVYKLAVDEGDKVRSGQFLMQIDPTNQEAQVRQLEASINAAKANLELQLANLAEKKADLEDEQELFDRELSSKTTLRKAKTALEVQQATVNSARQEIKRLEAGLETAMHELSKVNITADIDGIVTARNIEEGENVFVGAFNNPATVMLTIADLDTIEALVEVDETDIVDVKIGQSADIRVDAYPDSTFKGIITKVGHSPIASTAGQTQATSFEVIVELIDKIPLVRPGLSCKAEITTGYADNAVAVPIQALTLREESSLEPLKNGGTQNDEVKSEAEAKKLQGVFVVSERKVSFREVVIGIAGDRYFEVVSGLEPDEEVVTGPFSALRQLRNEEQVKVN